jgi:hypothetical protein
MASLFLQDNSYCVSFTRHGKRRVIYIGKLQPQQAEAVKGHIENLVGASVSGLLSHDTSDWVSSIPDSFHNKLLKFGLVPPRKNSKPIEKAEEYIRWRFGPKNEPIKKKKPSCFRIAELGWRSSGGDELLTASVLHGEYAIIESASTFRLDFLFHSGFSAGTIGVYKSIDDAKIAANEDWVKYISQALESVVI